MGKPVDVELGGAAGLEIGGSGVGGGGGVWAVAQAIGRAVSFRCVFVLALSVGVLVSALLLLVPTRGHGFLSDDPDVLGAEIQVGFTLEKPVSFLAVHMDKLGGDIFEEIGIPNSKCSSFSKRSINKFACPKCAEIILNSDDAKSELKDQLKLGLNLRSYEKVYLQFRNEIGSSVDAPATIEASVLDGSSILLPYRLKQLAQLIKEPNARNLGLNHSVFGKVKALDLRFISESISFTISIPIPISIAIPFFKCTTIFLTIREHPLPCTANIYEPNPTGKPPCFRRDPKLPPFIHSPQPSVAPSPYLSPAFPPIPGRVDPPKHLPGAVPGPTYQMMPIPSPSLPVFRPSMPPRKKQRKTKSPPSIAPSPYSLHS
uniref:DUF7036 domain-containing protein n=1 Tax=Oryza punctata TaxID=4537 RepID=A0A0E0M1Y9_ORYPU